MALLKKLPFYALAVIGGLLSGADLALSGGLLAQEAFLIIFFPLIYKEKSTVKLADTKFCFHFNKTLQSIAFIPHALGWVFGFFTIGLESKFGPKAILLVSSFLVMLGGAISIIVVIDLRWFLAGRIILGIGMTYLRQVIPKYLGDASPRESRDNLDVCYDMCSRIGVMLEIVFISYDLGNSILEIWRNITYPIISLALTLFFIILRIHQSPKYLLFRNKRAMAIQMLENIQEPDQVQQELNSLDIEVIELQGVNPFRELFRKSSIPNLCIHVPSFLFQTLMGSSTLLLFLPIFLVETSLDENPTAYATLGTCLTSLVATMISVVLIRHTHIRRRMNILIGCVIVIATQILLGVLIMIYVKPGNAIDHSTKHMFIFMMCTFVIGSTLVINPMGWLSQSYPRTARSVGSIFSLNLNSTMDFIVSMGLAFLLCSIRGWTFIFFGIVSVLMLLFVYFLLPADLPGVEMDAAWGGHRIWHRYVAN